MGVGEGNDRDGREKDGKRDRSGTKKRGKERQGLEREKDRETGAGDREIGRETGVWEREGGGEREGVTGEKEKKLQTQNNSWNLFLSCFTLQSGVKHDSAQLIAARQVSCFNPVTRDKAGKKRTERETGWERERERYN